MADNKNVNTTDKGYKKNKDVSISLGNDCFLYKNKKLVKSNNIFCYGNPDDKYIVLMEVLEKNQKVQDIGISTKVSIALFDRKEFIKNPNVMFLDFCERSGLYDALETAYMWISR